MSEPAVLVTGATGNVGHVVAAHLRRLEVPVRAAGLDLARLAAVAPSATPVRLDFTDPGSFRPALAGVDRVFLIRPPAIARVGRTINAFVDVAASCGVRHVVFSSVAGADSNVIVPHHRIETHLATTDLGWTVLRPGCFAQNLTTAYRDDVRDDDRLHVPAAGGSVAFVDTRDVGELAATILTDPSPHDGAGYLLTGPRAVTFDEVASALTRALGRPFRYQPATIAGYLRHLRTSGLPVAQRLVQTVLHLDIRRGGAATVDPTLARLLGRPATDIDEFIDDHRASWIRGGPTGPS